MFDIEPFFLCLDETSTGRGQYVSESTLLFLRFTWIPFHDVCIFYLAVPSAKQQNNRYVRGANILSTVDPTGAVPAKGGRVCSTTTIAIA